MTDFVTRALPDAVDVIAPDGSEVRLLPTVEHASMAHFRLRPGATSIAVAHRTVEEIWYCVGGRGQIWRKSREREEIVPLERGVAITIPLGTAFQFRTRGDEPLEIVGVTTPPWPGDDEAYVVDGVWDATVGPTS